MTCEKRPLTKKKALAVAARASKRTGEPFEAYHHPECHAWHVGHPKGWRAANQVGRGLARGQSVGRAAYEAVPDGEGGLTVVPVGTWRRDADGTPSSH